MSGEDTDREEGVDFTDLEPILEELSYPVDKDEFVAEHGDRAIERTNAEPITIRELYEGTGEDTFESSESIRQSILNFMPSEAVGREGYSDRGGATSEAASRTDESM